MSDTIQVDRFIRQKKTVSGQYAPRELAGLAEQLAGDEGEIRFTLTGSEAKDPAGGQKRRIRCIISGWFLVLDPVSVKPMRLDLDIESNLVVVKDESALPPLEFETEDEDYIVCAAEMNVMERVEEEILLDLPSALLKRAGTVNKSATSKTNAKSPASPASDGSATVDTCTAKVSPFARLAVLKKK